MVLEAEKTCEDFGKSLRLQFYAPKREENTKRFMVKRLSEMFLSFFLNR